MQNRMKMFLFLLSALGVAVLGAGEVWATACKCGNANGKTSSSAPTSGLCSIGTASSVKFVSGDSSLSGAWTWNCEDMACESVSCSAEKGTASDSEKWCCVDSSKNPPVCQNIENSENCAFGTKKSGECSSYCANNSVSLNNSTGPIIPSQLAGLPTNQNLVKGILTNIANFLLGIVGVIALIAFVISGLQYFLVATDEKMLETAKKTMINAIIGLIVALSGYIAVKTIEMLLGG